MLKFAWTLTNNGWEIQKIAQAPTAGEYKAVADEAAARRKQEESQAMEAVTGKPMSSDPQAANRQMLNVVPAAVGKAISDQTGGVLGGGQTPDEVMKGTIGPVMKGIEGMLGSDAETIKALSTSAGRSQALNELNDQMKKVQSRKSPNQEIISLLKKRINMVNDIIAGKMTPQQYVESENARMKSEMTR
jgi:hypothetical protein